MLGLLNLHKPIGITSRDAVNRVQRIIRPVKVGHAGTLDPLATGVLVLCLGKATRLITYIQDRPKRYLGTFELGKVSTTDDSEGRVETVSIKQVSRAEVETCLQDFVGDVQQIPPSYSAVHVQGKRAYQLARAGRQPDLEPRTVHIESLQLTAWNFPGFTLEIECGSGTYIRSLGRDIGQALGCGAYMTSLVRTAIGEFSLPNALDLKLLTPETLAQHLIPPGEAVRHLPRAVCPEAEKTNILTGKQFVPRSLEESAPISADIRKVAVYDEADDLVCLAERISGSTLLQPRQVFLERTD